MLDEHIYHAFSYPMNINKAIVLFTVMLFRRIQGCDYKFVFFAGG